jgi:nucleotidyltransferase/DNA polymerase involved in DNA repair
VRPRVCCVWLPGFGLHVAARLSTSLLSNETQTALYRPGTRYQELLECSPALVRAGIRPGLPLREAQARAPDAAFIPCDETVLAALERAIVPVLDALDSFSPIVEPPTRALLGDGRAVVYVEVTGLEPLYGPELHLGARLLDAASEASGVQGSAGIASTKFTAWVAASLASRITPPVIAVPENEDSLFLAPLPLETIPLPLQPRLALQRLGVRTLGAFAALPSNSVTLRLSRYKEDGKRAHLLAQGLDDSRLRPRRPPPTASVAFEFEWEESDLDRLTFALKILADQLVLRLAAHDPESGVSTNEISDDSDDAPSDTTDLHNDFWPEEPQLSREDDPADEPHTGHKESQIVTPFTLVSPAPSPISKAPPRSPFAVEALRVTWRLAGGETREMELRLAEPATTAAAFAEHLRWHAEGLSQFFAGGSPPEPRVSPDGFTYERIDFDIAITAIQLDALGLQLPPGTQLKLLAAPVRTPGTPLDAASRIDPLTRSRYARRAIARLQARWGPEVVRRITLTDGRLPERTYRLTDPTLSLQLDAPTARPTPDPPIDRSNPLSVPPPYWLFLSPEPAAILRPRKNGRPVLSLPRLRWRATIVQRGGPWKLVDPAALTEEPPLQRDYYHVETEGGFTCLLYWDRVADAWYVQGVFE